MAKRKKKIEKERTPTRIKLGKRIREFRKKKGWTQEHMGEVADINFKYLGAVERGERNLTHDKMEQIANALGVAIAGLFTDPPK